MTQQRDTEIEDFISSDAKNGLQPETFHLSNLNDLTGVNFSSTGQIDYSVHASETFLKSFSGGSVNSVPRNNKGMNSAASTNNECHKVLVHDACSVVNLKSNSHTHSIFQPAPSPPKISNNRTVKEIASTEELLESVGLTPISRIQQRAEQSNQQIGVNHNITFETSTSMLSELPNEDSSQEIFMNSTTTERSVISKNLPSRDLSNHEQHVFKRNDRSDDPSLDVSTDSQNLNIFASSINRLTEVIEQSFLRLDNSLQLLVSETRRLNERLIVMEDTRLPFVPPSNGTSTPPYQQPQLDAQQRLSSIEQRPVEQRPAVARGALFAPPVPTHRRLKSPEHSDSRNDQTRSNLPVLGKTREELITSPIVISTEEIRRKRLEEETKRAEAERRKVAAEHQRRLQLEQKTKNFMSSIMTDNNSSLKPGLFDDEPRPPNQFVPSSSGGGGHRNPLFDV